MAHHAYLAEGSPSQVEDLASFAERELGKKLRGTPLASIEVYATLGVDMVRELEVRARLASSDIKVFVIAAEMMTPEAQNAALKLFEEPPRNTFFFLLLPRGTILPTLRSRMTALLLPQSAAHADAEAFLAGGGSTRSDILAPLLERRDGAEMSSFIDALEVLIARGEHPSRLEALADIALVRRYLGGRGGSPKMLLEHLAAALPRLSPK